ncbi:MULTISPECIES: flavin reductase family protein [Pseudomonas]|uniref:Flavin reductase n=1 Tax=Pseudomonas putida TaxID=303 RepID=A0A059US52_PSEPU|nr:MULTISPECIES: flavin reductase family protein [Pseudomonas]AEJ12947.1 putative reductase [Pseudomonas putida S16]AHZ77156.1 reductase [Pseudomonas putida]KYC16927.1 reductase [Pseudomonas sp. ABFPK]MBF8745075.1 flavin reductase [Pseudomonas monteilii]MPS98332.1 flavin reductase [Pseudomonas sp.]
MSQVQLKAPIEAAGIDLQVFKDAMADFPAAVTIITTWDDNGQPVGATLSAVSSLSASPPMMLACFDRKSKTLEYLKAGKPFLIHVLGEGQEELAMLFAGKSTDKFAAVSWHRGELGLPTLSDANCALACEVADVLPGGDHLIVTGHIRHIDHNREQLPLLYHRRKMFGVPQQAAQA